jgi:hypothetical protein
MSKLNSVIREMNFAKSKQNYKARKLIYYALAHSHQKLWNSCLGELQPSHHWKICIKSYCTKCAQRNIKILPKFFFKFWKVFPVKKLFEYNLLCLKYFENHGKAT